MKENKDGFSRYELTIILTGVDLLLGQCLKACRSANSISDIKITPIDLIDRFSNMKGDS